jgi:hypothetical protein
VDSTLHYDITRLTRSIGDQESEMLAVPVQGQQMDCQVRRDPIACDMTTTGQSTNSASITYRFHLDRNRNEVERKVQTDT